MMRLDENLNEEILIENAILQIKEKFNNSLPFEHISIENFLKENLANKLKEALKNEEYYVEDHDLYRFLRTEDFNKAKSNILRELKEFFLSEDCIKFFENITKTKISRNRMDLHSLKLLKTHYLLCHDDQVEKRKFAFIIQLSEDFTEKDGGELELFNYDKNKNPTSVAVKVIPKFNQFNMFKISDISYHQINEVVSDKERITIGGWYYEN